jgi:hypothetical protein
VSKLTFLSESKLWIRVSVVCFQQDFRQANHPIHPPHLLSDTPSPNIQITPNTYLDTSSLKTSSDCTNQINNVTSKPPSETLCAHTNKAPPPPVSHSTQSQPFTTCPITHLALPYSPSLPMTYPKRTITSHHITSPTKVKSKKKCQTSTGPSQQPNTNPRRECKTLTSASPRLHKRLARMQPQHLLYIFSRCLRRLRLARKQRRSWTFMSWQHHRLRRQHPRCPFFHCCSRRSRWICSRRVLHWLLCLSPPQL